MKNNKLQLMLAGLFLCAAAMPAFADEKAGDEKKLETSAAVLDKDAAKPEGEKLVADKIKAEYGVDDARVQSLRDKKLGYGELSIALGLAKGLPGGITDANVDKIMVLRQGPPVMGWGKIAKDLGLKLGPVQSKVHKISSDLKKDKKEEGEKGKKGEKMEKHEKHEKAEKAEKMEKHEKPETGGKH